MFDTIVFDLTQLNFVTIIVRIFLAIFVGGLIGTERDMKQRAAGIRTHMLVCLGAAIVMMTNEYIYMTFDNQSLDVTRMGAQVVSGIGFIGAGTILVTSDNRIKGLTTAAGLWAAAALGLGIGIGFYQMALIGSIAIVGIMILIKPYKEFILDRSQQSDLLLMVHTNDGFSSFLDYMSKTDIKMTDIKVENDSTQTEHGHEMVFIVNIELGEKLHKDTVLHNLQNSDGIIHVIEVENKF